MSEAIKWWGWGDPERRLQLGASAQAMLAERLGEPAPAERAELEQVRLPEARPIPGPVAAAASAPDASPESRIRKAVGRGYPDLVRLRSGELDTAPDAVIRPGDVAELTAVIEACAGAGVAVVPFGGGTSVVGGVEALRGRHSAVVALDLGDLCQISIDRTSLTARLGPGWLGPAAEAALGAEGLTIGHFPQSFEYASIGGFAATRSAGQASAGYGRFDDLVTATEMVTPTGTMTTLQTPHTAAGPALRELILGSEGTLGVITDVTVRVRPAPAVRRYEAWMAESWEAGQAIVRELAQQRALPDVTRLSDESETEISLALSGTEGVKRSLLDGYLGLRRRRGGCMLITGWEGERESVERRRAVSARLLRLGGAAGLGTLPGKSWLHGRFDGPYLRDELMDQGYLVETLETSQTWSSLGALYKAVGSAISAEMEGQGTPGIVMCHLSHAYADGASLYFTFVCRARSGEELEQWRALKSRACDAIVSAAGTITHHHAVGRDHAPYMRAEVGETGLRALRALKDELDPAGIMNPGKLVSAAD
jgi:alkyldihydroxyacetonephosphate synthase